MAGLAKLLEIVQIGGWIILPLFLCSLLTVALIFEQFWYSFLSVRRMRKLIRFPQSFSQIQGMDMISRMVIWLRNHSNSPEEAQKRGLELIYSHFERRISWLNTFAAIAPLLGLLGTVSGMIRIFSIVATKEPTNPIASLSGGISEALFATGGGLLVAIMAALAYHSLQARQEWLAETMAAWFTDHRTSHLSR